MTTMTIQEPKFTTQALPTVTCGECSAPMSLKKTRYGLMWSCTRFPACRGCHGAHPNGMPLGTPANKATKQARIRAHDAFDPLWKGGAMSRGAAYRWLQAAMQWEKPVHIGELTETECEQVVAACAARKVPD